MLSSHADVAEEIFNGLTAGGQS